jgi:hypothetical protein
MWLLNVKTKTLREFHGAKIPAYAILSHTWGEDEVTFRELDERPEVACQRAGFRKILGTCAQAADDGYRWAWVDSCCIDKRSSAELSEAINSMFRWYQQAGVCYVFLDDVVPPPLATASLPPAASRLPAWSSPTPSPMSLESMMTTTISPPPPPRADASPITGSGDPPEVDDNLADQLTKSKWFTRGWTLQELIAPKKMLFFAPAPAPAPAAADSPSNTNTNGWVKLGTKASLLRSIEAITGVFSEVLTNQKSPFQFSAAERMSWAAKRQTTRDEDRAYCLVGLFNVSMPVLYGEGLQKAFKRLQWEIIRASPDETLFAWRTKPRSSPRQSGLLATSPSQFGSSGRVHQRALKNEAFRVHGMTNMGISMEVEIITPPPDPDLPPGAVIVPIGASWRDDDGKRKRLGLYLQPVLQMRVQKRRCYRRVKCDIWASARDGDFPRSEKTEEIFVLDDEHYREMRWVDEGGGHRLG